MKRYLSLLLVFLIFLSTAMAVYASSQSSVNSAILKYKKKNYIGCIQDLEALVKKDPSNPVAYYYLGLSYAQVGSKDKAKTNYEKVSTLNSDETLKKYAELGISCLDSPDKCKIESTDTEVDSLSKSKNFASPSASAKLKQMELDRKMFEFNQMNTNQKSDAKPTADDIKKAFDTLSKAGINPYQQAQQQYVSPELMQLNMMLGNQSSNGFYGMYPYSMNKTQNGNTNGQNSLKPEVIQAMMMQSMMGGLNLSN